MRLPNAEQSSAVLIGSSRYVSSGLADLPTILNNIKTLTEVLTDSDDGGIRPQRCTTLTDPAKPVDVSHALMRASEGTTDTLIVYFAGHGLINPRSGELYLALRDTDPAHLWTTALRYSDLREMFLDGDWSRAQNRVVILDCCYSGRAIGDMSDGALSGMLDIEGVYILTATARNRAALAPADQRYTAFTGALLELMQTGVPGGPKLLTLDTIYQQVKQSMVKRGLPVPEQVNRETIASLALCRNRASQAIGVASALEIDQRDSGNHLRALLATITDVMLVVVDDEDRITYASPAARAVFPRSDIEGIDVADLVAKDTVSNVLASNNTARAALGMTPNDPCTPHTLLCSRPTIKL